MGNWKDTKRKYYPWRVQERSFNGVRYRSTLEARWAIFFYKYGISYAYEHDVFCFPLFGTPLYRYIPDFTLFDCPYDFIEIKPSLPLDYEKQRCLTLSSFGYKVAIFAGSYVRYDQVKVYLFENGEEIPLPPVSHINETFDSERSSINGDNNKRYREMLGYMEIPENQGQHLEAVFTTIGYIKKWYSPFYHADGTKWK